MKAFVTGTDTGVGKTHATVLLTRVLRQTGLDTVALKPVCCGDREDAVRLCESADGELGLDDINPVWLPLPVSPLVAAEATGQPLNIDDLLGWFQRVTAGRQSFFVEGAGGWLVPMAPGLTLADFACALGLPVIVVVANRLGCLNHTLLTVAAIRAAGLTPLGLVINSVNSIHDDSVKDNRRILEDFTGLPVIAEIAYQQEAISAAMLRNASTGSAAAETGLPTTK
ncbi:MAG: dethiobiotin synthase [Terrimicrobiaceae bacterium]